MPTVLTRLGKVAQLLATPGALAAALSWRPFSMAAYKLVNGLKMHGVTPLLIIDVGANVGQFCVACANTFSSARIVAFEPLPEAYERLSGNSSQYRSVSARNSAIGDRQGNVDLRVNSFDQSSSLLALGDAHLQAFPGEVEVKTIQVPVGTLDTVLLEQPVEYPILVKIDVQGSELAVLRGGKEFLKKVQYVLIETSFKPLYKGEALFSEINRELEAMGFVFQVPLAYSADTKTGEIVQMDALYTRS